MKARIGLGTVMLAATLALAGCGGDAGNNQSATANTLAPLTQIPAPNNGDWTEVVSETPDGGYRMGNPDAPVKLIEYASITCPHCAEFAEAGTEPLVNTYVRSGQVSFEYRPYMIFPTDPGIFALLRCQGPAPFFDMVEQLYANQRDWSSRLQSLPPEQLQQTQAMSPTARADFMVRATGLDQFFRQRGMPEARVNSCLADNSGLERLADITRRAGEAGIGSTPTFTVNGEVAEGVGTWPALEQRLRAAIGG
jgi:protein-disulfide isomerase